MRKSEACFSLVTVTVKGDIVVVVDNNRILSALLRPRGGLLFVDSRLHEGHDEHVHSRSGNTKAIGRGDESDERQAVQMFRWHLLDIRNYRVRDAAMPQSLVGYGALRLSQAIVVFDAGH